MLGPVGSPDHHRGLPPQRRRLLGAASGKASSPPTGRSATPLPACGAAPDRVHRLRAENRAVPDWWAPSLPGCRRPRAGQADWIKFGRWRSAQAVAGSNGCDSLDVHRRGCLSLRSAALPIPATGPPCRAGPRFWIGPDERSKRSRGCRHTEIERLGGRRRRYGDRTTIGALGGIADAKRRHRLDRTTCSRGHLVLARRPPLDPRSCASTWPTTRTVADDSGANARRARRTPPCQREIGGHLLRSERRSVRPSRACDSLVTSPPRTHPAPGGAIAAS
jgi:hypothetical protein